MSATKSRYTPKTEEHALWAFSAGYCALCQTSVFSSNENNQLIFTGEKAHICGREPGSARYVESMSDPERDSYDNLLVMCSSCHTKIDSLPVLDEYSEQNLRDLKSTLESKIKSSVEVAVTTMTFKELDVITRHLIANHAMMDDYVLITPKEKIIKNNLSGAVAEYIAMGLIQKRLIEEFINSHPNESFIDNLKSGFIDEYHKLTEAGYWGDALFDKMWQFASSNRSEAQNRAAGLTVLTHLFELCDIFEK